VINKENFMTITSPAFENGGIIPEEYSREGGDKSPPLEIQDVPLGTKSLALIVDDPDAPQSTFTHWLLYNIAPDSTELSENVTPIMMKQGRNDYGETCYGGPKPPSGVHRYFFRLYALDDNLSLPRGASRVELERALSGRVLAEAEYMGRFAAHATVTA
jgi:Raf kinase inhibitor-like YbhB/YbcL family protein